MMPGCRQQRWVRAGLTALLLLCGSPLLGVAADSVRIQAKLVRASNEPAPPGGGGGVDARIQRLFNFKSYQNYGGGSATATVPSTTSISLGHGNQLALRLAPAAGNRIEAGIAWTGPSGKVLNTTAVLTRGVPFILGGGQQDGGTMIISITAR